MKKTISLVILFSVLMTNLLAQEAVTAQSTTTISPVSLFYIVVGLTVIVSLLVITVAWYMLKILKHLIRETATEQAEKQQVECEASPGFWSRINQLLTRSTPVEGEEKIMLDHSYDGIRELDNHLPPWWTALLYGSIVWSVIYLFLYHVSDSLPLPVEEYENELAYAEKQRQIRELQATNIEKIDENTVAIVTDEVALEDGKKTFINICASCHRLDAGGDIGPNLTDPYWLHGGSIKNIFKIVSEGVPSTSMIAWSNSISPEKIQNVSSYMLTLQGTSPPNAKAKEGELYTPEEEAKVAQE